MNGGRAGARLLTYSSPFSQTSVCTSCQRSLRRGLASAAAAEAPPPPPAEHTATPTQPAQPGVRPVYHLHAGVVLSRPPLLTREYHPFEKAYFLYQKRLNERTVLPFTRYFYMKEKTPTDLDWRRKIKERLTPARDIGVYSAYGKEAWNDEVLLGAPEGDPAHQIEMLVKDAEPASVDKVEAAAGVDATEAAATPAAAAASKGAEFERPLPRVTAADDANDQQSLNRALQRTLFLLVQDSNGQWAFPSAQLVGKEGFNKAAERVIFRSAGPNMNTWVVGHAPIGHHAEQFESPVLDQEKQTAVLGAKTFFMKARIMGGQANVKAAEAGYRDFKWLTKEELKPLLSETYWRYTANMLEER